MCRADAGVWVLYGALGHRSGHLCRSHCRNLLLFRREGAPRIQQNDAIVELPSYNVSFSREEGVQIEYVVASRVWGGERNVRNCALYLIACRDGKQERWSIVKPLFAGRSLRLSSHSAYTRDRSTRGRDQTVSGRLAGIGKRKSHIQVRLPRMDRNSFLLRKAFGSISCENGLV